MQTNVNKYVYEEVFLRRGKLIAGEITGAGMGSPPEQCRARRKPSSAWALVAHIFHFLYDSPLSNLRVRSDATPWATEHVSAFKFSFIIFALGGNTKFKLSLPIKELCCDEKHGPILLRFEPQSNFPLENNIDFSSLQVNTPL